MTWGKNIYTHTHVIRIYKTYAASLAFFIHNHTHTHLTFKNIIKGYLIYFFLSFLLKGSLK